MLDPNAIKERIHELISSYHIALQELQFRIIDDEEYDLELHRCQSIISEISELEAYLKAFKDIKEED